MVHVWLQDSLGRMCMFMSSVYLWRSIFISITAITCILSNSRFRSHVLNPFSCFKSFLPAWYLQRKGQEATVCWSQCPVGRGSSNDSFHTLVFYFSWHDKHNLCLICNPSILVPHSSFNRSGLLLMCDVVCDSFSPPLFTFPFCAAAHTLSKFPYWLYLWTRRWCSCLHPWINTERLAIWW